MTLRIRGSFGQRIDYTALDKRLSYGDVERVCLQAATHKLGRVVVPSMLVSRAVKALDDAEVIVSCYVGYPFGTQAASVKAREAEDAVASGAGVIEVVPHYGSLRAGRWSEVEDELRILRAAVGDAVLALCLEVQYLSDGAIDRACDLASSSACETIANASGFRTVSTQPETQAQATPETVRRLAQVAGERVQIKAIGGIDTQARAVSLIEAGARRVAIDAVPGLLTRFARAAEEER